MKPLFALTACALALSMPSLGSASTLYSSLPDNDLSAPDITAYSGAGKFTLADDALVGSATIALWMDTHQQGPPSIPAAVDWAIEDFATNTVLISGSGATLTNDGPTFVRDGLYALYYSTFTIPSAALSAGDYWLRLSNCAANDQSACGWGLNSFSGPDLQFQPAVTGIGKYAFSIQAADAAQAPEPATWLTFIPALAGLAIYARRASDRPI